MPLGGRCNRPATNDMTNNTINIKNKTLAIPADAAAIPEKPNTAATNAIIRNTIAHVNIFTPFG